MHRDLRDQPVYLVANDSFGRGAYPQFVAGKLVGANGRLGWPTGHLLAWVQIAAAGISRRAWADTRPVIGEDCTQLAALLTCV